MQTFSICAYRNKIGSISFHAKNHRIDNITFDVNVNVVTMPFGYTLHRESVKCVYVCALNHRQPHVYGVPVPTYIRQPISPTEIKCY